MFYYIHSLLSYCCIIPLDLMHLINRSFIVFWLPHVLYIKYMKQIFKTRNGMWKGTCCVCLSMYRLFHSIFSSSIQLLVNFNFCIRDDFLFFFFSFYLFFIILHANHGFTSLFSSSSFPLIPSTPFPIYTLLVSLQTETGLVWACTKHGTNSWSRTEPAPKGWVR